jgi:hypothetical protein
MSDTFFDKDDVLTAKIHVHKPFDMFMCDPWVWVQDACNLHDSEEYYLLDRIVCFLDNDILREELPPDLARLTPEAMREEYSKRFPILFGKALQVIGKQMQDDEIRLEIEYPDHEE